MKLSDLFNIPVGVVPSRPRSFGPTPTEDGERDPPTKSVGAFITVQSLVSFTGATGAIGLIWSAIKSLNFVPMTWNIYVGMLLSLLIGMLIYYINVSDPNSQHTRRDKVIGLFIALLNTLVLFNATKSIVGN
jgi:hypothetical protein